MIKIIGIILICGGVAILVYQGFSYTTVHQDAKIGPLVIQHDETKTVDLPPVVGIVALVAGLAMLFIPVSRSM